MHRLVREMLAVMPPDGTPWPRPARERWLAALAAVLDVLHEDESGTTFPQARARTASARETAAPASPFVDGPRPGEPPAPDQPREAGASEWPEETGFYLDLRPEPVEASSSRGKHARQPAD
jgi:hypothetical protein